jgi:hypothetical protein
MWKAFVLAALFSVAPMASGQCATPADISGQWQGVFDYDRGDEWPATFDATLHPGAGNAFQGSIVELNTFSDEPYAFLLSNVTGRVNGSTVQFTKSYVASGAVTHSVTYQGTLDSSGRRITGTWATGGAKGIFEMAR